MLNDHRPDINKLFKEQLKMDLTMKDVKARISKYFQEFDEIIEDHGLKHSLGVVPEGHEEFRDRMKSRCKILIANLAPAMLRRDVERMVALDHRAAKSNDLLLYKLVKERAIMQHHYRLLAAGERTRQNEGAGGRPGGGGKNGRSQERKPREKWSFRFRSCRPSWWSKWS